MAVPNINSNALATCVVGSHVRQCIQVLVCWNVNVVVYVLCPWEYQFVDFVEL